MSDNKPAQTSRKGSGSYGMYKSQDRYNRNKRRRADKHDKRMLRQILRVTERYVLGKPLSTKTYNKCVKRAYFGP